MAIYTDGEKRYDYTIRYENDFIQISQMIKEVFLHNTN